MKSTNRILINKKSRLIDTKIGMRPIDWDIVYLGDIGTFKNGINKDKKDFGHGVPLINLKDVFNNDQISKPPESSVNASASEIKRYSLKRGDVLFVRSSVKPRGVGLVSLITSDLPNTVFSGFLIRFRQSKKMLIDDFQCYCFSESGFRRRLIVRSSISANTNINQNNLNQLLICAPSISEQEKIVSILISWDKAINQTGQLIKAKKKQKKALIQQLLTGKRRFKEFKNKTWKIHKIGDYFSEFTERSLSNNKNYKILSCTKLYGIISQEERFKKRLAASDISRYKVLKKGDLVYDPMLLWDASIGFLKSYDIGVVSPAYSTFNFNKSKGDLDFFEALLDTHYMRHQYKIISQGTNTRRRKAPTKAFMKIKINMPPTIEEQKAIADVYKLLNHEIDLLTRKSELLIKQKKGLMQKLLTGKIRVKV